MNVYFRRKGEKSSRLDYEQKKKGETRSGPSVVNEAFLNDPVAVELNANEGDGEKGVHGDNPVKTDDSVGSVELLVDKDDGVGDCDADEEQNNKPKYAVLNDDTYGNQESKYTLL